MARPRRDLFISHSGDDAAAATEIRAMLEGAGYTVWMAPDDIVGSRPWAEQIVEAIDSSRAMIVLLSSRANESPYVSREVNLAFSRKRAVLPIRLEPVAPEAALELFLALVQRVDAFPPPISGHRDTILKRLELMLDEVSPTRRRRATPHRVPSPRSAPPEPAQAVPGPRPNATSAAGRAPSGVGIGSRVGAFTIEAVLGEGGMATVYRARQDEPNRAVALKVIRADHAADATYRARFLSEKDTLASLEHPSIIPIYAAGDDHGVLYIAMRLVDGNDLAARLRERGPLSLRETIETLRPIADAIDYAHARGVVHRDLKPSNIVLDRDGRAYLMDFGLGKRVRRGDDETTGLSSPGIAVGTLQYMAPEQLTGDPNLSAAPAIDLYAFGSIVFTCLTGHAPYADDTPEQMLAAQSTGQLPSVVSARPELPKAVDAVVRRALARSPADRYGSAADLVAALQGASVLSDQSTELIKIPKRPSPWVRALGWARSSTSRSAVAAVVVLALLASVAYGWNAVAHAGGTSDLPTPHPTLALPTGGTAVTPAPTPFSGRPEAPTQFTVTSPFAVAADVSWAPGQGSITGFHLYRGDIPIRDAPAADTSLRDFGLLPGTTYHYSIEAFGPSGLSTRQDVSVTTGTNPTAARLEGSRSVSLSYSASTYPAPKPGDVQSETWVFTPQCSTGACTVTVSGVHGRTEQGTLELQDDGSYAGTYEYSFDEDTCGTVTITAKITMEPPTPAYTLDGAYVASSLSGTYSDSATSNCKPALSEAKVAANDPGDLAELTAKLNADAEATNDAMACAALKNTPDKTLTTELVAKAKCTVSGHSLEFYSYPTAGATASAFSAFLHRDESQDGSAGCSASPVSHGDGEWSVPQRSEVLGRVWCGEGDGSWTYTWSYLPGRLIGFGDWPDGNALRDWWVDPAHWLAPSSLP